MVRTTKDWLEEAESCLVLKDTPDALFCLKKAIDLDDDNSRAWFLKGCAHMEDSDYKQALKSLDLAMEKGMGDAQILALKGAVSGILGDSEASLNLPGQGPFQRPRKRLLLVLQGNCTQIQGVCILRHWKASK